ncbi:MAG: ABC-2 transporter permease [Oscillospiraceae bacterium]|nr:ABC-2 transporter permease [Oscillospiraceae bacterium]
MRGLLLKDLYMAWKYCKLYLLMVVGFLMIAAGGHSNSFFLIYPSIMSGLIPMSLLAYDEQHKWDQYSLTLPYTRVQLVSVKFLVGLALCFVVVISSALVLAIRMLTANEFSWNIWIVWVGSVLCSCLLGPSLCLPFMFKLGAEKGRIFYSISLGLLCAICVLLTLNLPTGTGITDLAAVIPLACLVSIAIFALSWWLSIRFYEKREF